MEINVGIFGWIFPLMFAAAVVYLVLEFSPEEGVGEHPGSAAEARRRRGKSLFLMIFGGLIRFLGQIISTLPLGERREALRKKLQQAGRPGNLSPDEYHAARIVGVFLAVFAGLFFDNEMNLFPVCMIGLGTLGFVYPDIWLSGTIQKRRRRIFRDLPDFLDTLRLAVDAGLDLSSALKVCVEKGRRGPLLDELELVERDITLGRTRAEAFRSFADRLMMSEINAFVLALIQADRLGASIGPILKVQAEVARTKRWQAAEVIVNKMPMKMLGPLVLFIFPASFIVLFTPLIIQYMQSTD